MPIALIMFRCGHAVEYIEGSDAWVQLRTIAARVQDCDSCIESRAEKAENIIRRLNWAIHHGPDAASYFPPWTWYFPLLTTLDPISGQQIELCSGCGWRYESCRCEELNAIR